MPEQSTETATPSDEMLVHGINDTWTDQFGAFQPGGNGTANQLIVGSIPFDLSGGTNFGTGYRDLIYPVSLTLTHRSDESEVTVIEKPYRLSLLVDVDNFDQAQPDSSTNQIIVRPDQYGRPTFASDYTRRGNRRLAEVAAVTVNNTTLFSDLDTLTFTFGELYDIEADTSTTPADIVAGATQLRSFVNHQDWSGFLLFFYYVSPYQTSIVPSTQNVGLDFYGKSDSVSVDESLLPVLTYNRLVLNTGHDKGRPGDRAVECQRTGRRVGASELQEDGYLPGIWTVADQWEPEDSRETPINFPDTERDRMDEVPD